MRRKKEKLLKQRRERLDFSENILFDLDCANLNNFYRRSKKELIEFLDLLNLGPFDEITDDLLDPNQKSP
jgi:hypothetical protein